MLPWIFVAASALMSAPANPPIWLVVEPVGEGVRLKVIGQSAVAVAARYSLEVDSGTSAGSNRTTQGGNARLAPGVEAVLTTVNLGRVEPGRWTARLRVESESGAAYELTNLDAPR